MYWLHVKTLSVDFYVLLDQPHLKFFTLYILLGAYMYLLKLLMKRLDVEKKELLARLASFNYSGVVSRITGNL